MKKLWTSRVLTTFPVHSTEFEEQATLTSSYFTQGLRLRFRICHLLLEQLQTPCCNFIGKIILALTKSS